MRPATFVCACLTARCRPRVPCVRYSKAAADTSDAHGRKARSARAQRVQYSTVRALPAGRDCSWWWATPCCACAASFVRGSRTCTGCTCAAQWPCTCMWLQYVPCRRYCTCHPPPRWRPATVSVCHVQGHACVGCNDEGGGGQARLKMAKLIQCSRPRPVANQGVAARRACTCPHGYCALGPSVGAIVTTSCEAPVDQSGTEVYATSVQPLAGVLVPLVPVRQCS